MESALTVDAGGCVNCALGGDNGNLGGVLENVCQTTHGLFDFGGCGGDGRFGKDGSDDGGRWRFDVEWLAVGTVKRLQRPNAR